MKLQTILDRIYIPVGTWNGVNLFVQTSYKFLKDPGMTYTCSFSMFRSKESLLNLISRIKLVDRWQGNIVISSKCLEELKKWATINNTLKGIKII